MNLSEPRAEQPYGESQYQKRYCDTHRRIYYVTYEEPHLPCPDCEHDAQVVRTVRAIIQGAA